MPRRKPDVEEADMNGEAVGVTPNRRRRIHLTLNEDESSIDWSSTSERDKQRFSSLVSNDADALEMIGLAAGQAETTPITVDRDSIPLIYDTIACFTLEVDFHRSKQREQRIDQDVISSVSVSSCSKFRPLC